MSNSNPRSVKALLFDVFGTVVDYRSTIIREGNRINNEKNLEIDWALIADKWRGKYRPTLNLILNGEMPWTKLDNIHHQALLDILDELNINSLSYDEVENLNRIWHRLSPWGDSVEGLTRLKEKYIISPLSNGNISLLTNMAKYSKLPWDLILSPELIQSYKPDEKVYLMASNYLDLKPQEIMMVAAHQYDLQAAKKLGFHTAYIFRPLEFGYEKINHLELAPNCEYDYIANDLVDLARLLGL